MIDTGSRYHLLPGLLLAFHGTDQETANKVLSGQAHLKPSQNEYDWLGHGIYCWEYSPQRALEFANEKKKRGEIESVAVIGVVVDPGVCLNLLEASALNELKAAYDLLAGMVSQGMVEALPENTGGRDLYKRKLDCAVIELLHELLEVTGQPYYDTVRAAFWEGGDLYPGAGFEKKNHVQLCIRSTDCIKGYFKPLSK